MGRRPVIPDVKILRGGVLFYNSRVGLRSKGQMSRPFTRNVTDGHTVVGRVCWLQRRWVRDEEPQSQQLVRRWKVRQVRPEVTRRHEVGRRRWRWTTETTRWNDWRWRRNWSKSWTKLGKRRWDEPNRFVNNGEWDADATDRLFLPANKNTNYSSSKLSIGRITAQHYRNADFRLPLNDVVINGQSCSLMK